METPHPLAELLHTLRRERRRVPEVPPELRPADMVEGYRIQDQLVEALGGEPIGYKVALTSATAQELVGYGAPTFGTMLSTLFWTAPVELTTADFTTRIIETEFGFRIGRDVPPGTPRHRIPDYVDSVLPSIEIVDHRFPALDAIPAPVLVADNSIHGGWIRGEPVTGWALEELDSHQVGLHVNGEQILAGAGDRVLGHPLEVLAWLADELGKHGRSLRAGDYVTTGLATDGIYDAVAGDDVVADFGELGQVELRFT